MVRTQIQLTEKQIQELKTMAAERNLSLSELIRQSVDHYIARTMQRSKDEQRDRALGIAGRFHSCEPDSKVSTEQDDYLAEIYSS